MNREGTRHHNGAYVFWTANGLGRLVAGAGLAVDEAVLAEPVGVVRGEVHQVAGGNDAAAVGVVEVLDDLGRADLHVFELEIPAADVQCIVLAPARGVDGQGVSTHRSH